MHRAYRCVAHKHDMFCAYPTCALFYADKTWHEAIFRLEASADFIFPPLVSGDVSDMFVGVEGDPALDDKKASTAAGFLVCDKEIGDP